MDLINLLWIFFLIASVAPLIRQRMIDAARQRIIQSIESKRGSRVISLIHRQESMSILGFPLARYIDIQDSEQILRAIQLTDPQVPIDLILHTPGGLVLAAEQIANALSKRTALVTVIVPHYAMSGGTMIALAADEILMDDNAVLGPVDPQIGNQPAVSILAVLDRKDINKVDDETLIHADVARKAIRQVKDTLRRIACCHYTPEQAEHLAEMLASGNWTHDYPITVEEGRALGLKINTEVPREIYQLMNLYPQARQRRPSVEYIPVPYPNRPRRPEGPDEQ
ncbi:MAG TPA: ATP-dependent Clp protease proteolytic subunit [Anaerolineaceae bacterium]|nr:ATP-dependent Clp protease proteolytic subunit [Anaerolineaceae bacterium]